MQPYYKGYKELAASIVYQACADYLQASGVLRDLEDSDYREAQIRYIMTLKNGVTKELYTREEAELRIKKRIWKAQAMRNDAVRFLHSDQYKKLCSIPCEVVQENLLTLEAKGERKLYGFNL